MGSWVVGARACLPSARNARSKDVGVLVGLGSAWSARRVLLGAHQNALFLSFDIALGLFAPHGHGARSMSWHVYRRCTRSGLPMQPFLGACAFVIVVNRLCLSLGFEIWVSSKHARHGGTSRGTRLNRKSVPPLLHLRGRRLAFRSPVPRTQPASTPQ